jgi:hypothetical protein
MVLIIALYSQFSKHNNYVFMEWDRRKQSPPVQEEFHPESLQDALD